MGSVADPELRAHLAAQVDALRDEYVSILRERIPFYRAVPDASLRASAAAVIGLFLEASLPTWTYEPIVAWVNEHLPARAAAGLPREGALALGACFRRLFLQRVASLLEAGLPDVPRLLLFIHDFCEACNTAIGKVYDDALEQAQRALRESEARFRELVELSPDGVAVYRNERFLYINPAGLRIMGVKSPAELSIRALFPPERRAETLGIVRAAVMSGNPTAPTRTVFVRPDGRTVDVELIGAPIRFEGHPARQVVFRDITERKRVEEALHRAAVQEETIRAQEAMLRELSTPLIPVSDGVVVMPLIGVVDRARAEQLRQVLLEGISAAGAKVAILDVTGVPAMDAGVAEALLLAVSAARLLGAQVVLTGVKPAAARALVELGVNFGHVVTRGTLKDGILHALARERV